MSTIITGEAKKSFKAIVVKELPEKGILNNLYFVLNGDEGDNKYDEYIWIKDPDTQQYMWEKVGYSYVDLTPYYTKTEIDGKLSPINNNLLRLNTETTFHPVININQIKPGGGQGTNKDRWTIDQAVLAAWQWINEDLTNRGDYLSPGISIMFRATNLRDVNGFDGAWLIHNYSDVDFSESAFTNPDKWCRVLTEADFKFEAADKTYSGFLLNTDYIKFDNAVKSITAHSTNYNNPHQVTKEQVGLGNVDNTADLDKPLSHNDKTALDLKVGSISFGSIGSSLVMNLYSLKEPIELGSGIKLSSELLDAVQIPLVTPHVSGLMSPDKLGTINYTYGKVNTLSSDISSIRNSVNFVDSSLNSYMAKIGSSVVDIGTDMLEDSIVKTLASRGVGLIRGSFSQADSSKAVVLLNDNYGPEVVQYKYAGGQQFKRTIQSNGTASAWKVVGPTTIEVDGTIVSLKDDTGAVISSSRLPVVGSDTGYGLLSSDTYNSLISIPEQLNSRIKTSGVQYNEASVVLGTANGQAIEIKEATSTTAGVLGTSLYQILDRASKLPYVESIRIGEYSPDYITLALLDPWSYPLSQVTIPCADLTNAGVMSASNYQKLQLLELTEPLANSDITALFS